MDGFPLTRKKLFSLTEARRQKWLANWLKSIYVRVLEEQLDTPSKLLFFRQYRQVSQWLGEDIAPFETNSPNKAWIRFIADRFHWHCQKAGNELTERDFLPQVITGDRPEATSISKLEYCVALDNLRSAFNVGSVIRVVDAIGFDTVLLGGITPNLSNRKVEKTAMGCESWISTKVCSNLTEELEAYKNDGYLIVGLETVELSAQYNQFPWPKKCVIVLGNEEYGISEEILKTCDEFVHIPMVGRKNSVNVANAFSVVGFHICRQIHPDFPG